MQRHIIVIVLLSQFFPYLLSEDKKFVIVIPSFNNINFYQYNLNSVCAQTYKNYRVIYIDDCSTDKTGQKVHEYIKLKKLKNFRLIRNKNRKGALANHYTAIHLCDDNEIIICLDGDDWFAHKYVLEEYNKQYQDPTIWLVYAQFNNWPDNKRGWCEAYPLDIIRQNKFREFGFVAAQGRSYYAWLAKLVKLQDLLSNFRGYESQFYPAAGDVALMFPMLEMARNNFKFIPQVLIQRNVQNPLNDFKINCDLQLAITHAIQRKEKYKILESPVREQPTIKTQKKAETYKADLIIFSYDRPLQLYALLESIEKYVSGIGQLSIIYRTSDINFESAYAEIKNRFPSAQFISQGPTHKLDFKPLLLGTIFGSPHNYILFAVDDIIVKDYINVETCVRELKRTHAYGFYLRLGKNISHCYMTRSHAEFPPAVEITPGIYAWQFGYAKGDWSFPPSVDMTVFNKEELLEQLKNLEFISPNIFEMELYCKFDDTKSNYNKVGLCFAESKIVNIPINLVQTDIANRNMNKYTKHDLLEKFNAGLTIDIKKFYKIKNSAPHIECDLKFITQKNFRSLAPKRQT